MAMNIRADAGKFWRRFSLPQKTAMLFSCGLACGLFLYFNVYANTPYYLSAESRMCVQCHVMESQYATWNHSAHRQYAQCGDCHLPHHNPVAKYAIKARDGMKDLTLFMLRMEANIPHSTASTKEIIRGNCLRCHEKAMTDVDPGTHIDGSERLCWNCHRDVPHGRTRGLASVNQPGAQLITKPVPAWLKVKLTQTE
ncbi:MAG TPA: cytochrome c nitrite reductase small subunit [Candidatus Aminicenantes bacterium]|nr:cytochrome c nitrite reductase small subunit [Candidatus Aminicenantes bacterium]